MKLDVSHHQIRDVINHKKSTVASPYCGKPLNGSNDWGLERFELGLSVNE
jgi:hypothetical protein